MYNTIDYKEIIEGKFENYILVDVRSPYEYGEDTIPGAVNIPILDNEERIAVGTSYKQVSAREARLKGIDIVSRKLPDIYRTFLDLIEEYDRVIVFCYRGGYRSSSIVSFLNSIGNKVYKLGGGYKSYRKHVNEYLPKEVEKVEFIVLYGNTGVGKTKILHEIKNKGGDVIDLEGFANHRGSTLGGVGLDEQNSQKTFESLILSTLMNRKSDTIYIEGESRRIGRVLIPEYIYEKMQVSTKIQIKADMDKRVEVILEDYLASKGDKADIIEALNHMRKRLGNDKVDGYIALVKEDDYALVAEELMLYYYDPMYEHNEHVYREVFKNEDDGKTAASIIEWTKNREDL